MTDLYNGYYAGTAYDSTKPRNVPLPDSNKKTLRTRWQGNFNLVRPCQCCEFIGKESIAQAIRILRGEEQYEDESLVFQKVPTKQLHQAYYILGAGARVLIGGLKLFAAVGLLSGIISFIAIAFGHGIVQGIKVSGPILVVCYASHKLCDYLIRTGKVRHIITAEFNRNTGMVRNRERGQWIELPFDEFDPCMRRITDREGVQHALHLVHRAGKTAFLLAWTTVQWDGWRKWEFLQHYMDISKPLPDIPRFEKYRHLDPATAEYDKKWGRPKNFWQNMDIEAANYMEAQSDKAAQNFPWGLTREEALAQGWRPSPYNDMNLRELY